MGLKRTKNYDVGLGTKKFHVFVKGRTTAIASRNASSLATPKAVDVWAKKKYLAYLKSKRKK